jgi:hypothetical protein
MEVSDLSSGDGKKDPIVSETLVSRIQIGEFLIQYPELSDMQKAGFKAFVGKEWMRPEEWSDSYVKYQELCKL